MEPVTIVVDKLKGFAKSSQDFAHGLLNWHQNSNRRSPVEILKRLQREAFSDIMKLRDRQDKVERTLTFYKSSKGSPFHESSTRLKGNVNVLGAIFMMDEVDEQKRDAVQRSCIRTGTDARYTFETAVREKDILAAEFMAGEKGGPLSLTKVFYEAQFSDRLSAVAIPMGAQCRDVGVGTSSNRDRALTHYSEFGPPLLNQNYGSALGIMVKKSNMVASLAQFVHSTEIARSLGTFGQVLWQLSRNTKLSIFGVHRKSTPSSQMVNLGSFSIPITLSKQKSIDIGSPRILDRSIAVMLDSELDESTRIGGWVETKNSNPRSIQWAVTICDAPEDEFGWGLTLGGSVQGPKSWDHIQVETFFNLNIGKGFKLQPGLVFVMDGGIPFPAFMLRSSWSI